MANFKAVACWMALLWVSCANAQYHVTITDTDNQQSEKIQFKKNAIKTNATAIFSGQFTLAYERDVLDWLSLEATLGMRHYLYQKADIFFKEFFEVPLASTPDSHGGFFEVSAIIRFDEDFLGDYGGLGVSFARHFWPYDSQSNDPRIQSQAVGLFYRYQYEFSTNIFFNVDVGAFSHLFKEGDEYTQFSIVPRFRLSLGYLF
jgi:hypothetical protein